MSSPLERRKRSSTVTGSAVSHHLLSTVPETGPRARALRLSLCSAFTRHVGFRHDAQMTKNRVGIIGAGQLGRMLALAGYPLGIECTFLDRDPASPGAQVAKIFTAELDDAAALARLSSSVDVVTLDIENVPVAALESLARRVAVLPPPAAVGVAQDRLTEKQLFQSLDIPTAPFVTVHDRADLRRAAEVLGWPVVLKARRLGYDGRGQRIADSMSALVSGWDALGNVPAIAEGWIEYERELSLIGVRGAGQAEVFYPLAENVHRDGILMTTVAPYEELELQQQAQRWLLAMMQHLDYRGALAVEFFQTQSGLVANEMAPRVHNSGHWTIEGAVTSQFENHLRAVLGWPLGDPSPLGHAAMLNLLGELPAPEIVLGVPGAHLHTYGKTARAARKVGHCTLVDRDRARLLARLEALQDAVQQRRAP
jgi:5-(carboxyamino)imidazole ribonucleotide synthase